MGVSSSHSGRERLSHIEFLQLSDKRILVVLVTTSNIIYNRIIRLEENLTQEDLERTARYLNTEFSGKSLITIRAEILDLMREEKALYDRLLRNAILLCDMSLNGEESSAGEVYVDGASNMLTKPDFVDVDRMRELFRTFEEKSRLLKILNECVSREQPAFRGDVKLIGREHPPPHAQLCLRPPYGMGSTRTQAPGSVGPREIEIHALWHVNYMDGNGAPWVGKKTLFLVAWRYVYDP